MPVHKRVSRIEHNWAYFMGFGLPLALLTSLPSSFFVRQVQVINHFLCAKYDLTTDVWYYVALPNYANAVLDLVLLINFKFGALKLD